MDAKATDKQIAFATTLVNERYIGDKASLIASLETLSKVGISRTIEKLLALPRAVAVITIESGIYTDGSLIFKVYKGQSGRMLAKELIGHEVTTDEGVERYAEFEYRGAAERFVKGMRKMTLDEAKEFGAIYGVCCNCGATLTAEDSIEAGIGPVCAKRFA